MRDLTQSKRRFRGSVFIGLWFVACSLLLLPSGFLTKSLIPVDEGAHIDYAIHLANGVATIWDTKYSQDYLRINECVGTFFNKPGNCLVKVRTPESYPPNGWSYEAQQTPLGYVPAALVWRLGSLELMNPIEQIKILRLSNIFWILLSGIFLVFLAREMRLGWRAQILLASFLAANSEISRVNTYLTNDAALLSLSLISLVTFSYSMRKMNSPRRKINKFLLLNILVGVLLGLTKLVLIIAPLSLLGALILNKCRKSSAESKMNVWLLLSQTVGCGLGFGLYAMVVGIFSKTSSTTVFQALMGFSVGSDPLPTLYSGVSAIPSLLTSEANLIGSCTSLIFIGCIAIAIYKNTQLF